MTDPSAHTLTSTAVVPTDRPERYAKQLAAHLGRRLEVVDEGATTRVLFPRGECRLTPDDGALEMRATAPADVMPQVQDVVGRHLEKFGARDGLRVEWSQAE